MTRILRPHVSPLTLAMAGLLLAAGCRDHVDQSKDSPSTAAGASQARDGSGPSIGQAAGADEAHGAANGPEVSITGCLTSSLEGRSYALTPTDTRTTPAERAMQVPGRDTLTYELVGDAELFRPHANTVVTARGREDASVRRDAEVEREDETEQRPAAGMKDTPTVETKEEVDVNVRRLHVTTVVATGNTCPSMGGTGR
ncbi:hypothetical protein TBR22_A08910 [Luteitalea sp. TBR-22]|uniref:hypothetical protein n=1 Tax=Luteitalea sp. TBR-22 TaxID=2802971 RepID=UPI001AF9E513|nr:hypothetical protein [Luteitalea sp. TBR-22]BCS31688.1 hypothetical protein TBR22_A08910 [Luteitalea sp. TBR-22]